MKAIKMFFEKHKLSQKAQKELMQILDHEFYSDITIQESTGTPNQDITIVTPPTMDEGQTLPFQSNLSSIPSSNMMDAEQTVRLSANSRTIDMYERMGLLGKGGMGLVIRVFDKKLKRSLALKLLNPKFVKDNASCLRFIEEAQICAQLQHPNIVPVYSMGTEGEQLYFTMREVEGFHLGTVIKELHESIVDEKWKKTKRGWSFRQSIEILIQVSKTIAFAHSKGVIHRDLKPSNIMLGEFGEVLIIDWGVAKIIGNDIEQSIQTSRSEQRSFDTMAGEISGTPSYMSPEQARGDIDRQGPWSDIYSLGCILYEILSGLPPYTGTTAKGVIQRVLSSPPQPLKATSKGDFAGFDCFDQSNDRIPEDLVTICEKAMQKDIRDRYATAIEFAAALEDWLTGQKNRQEALALVEQAQELQEKIFNKQEEAKALLSKAKVGLVDIPENAPEEQKETLWKMEDQGKELLEEAHLIDSERELLLHKALSHKPDLLEAHLELASEYQRRHTKAEKNKERAIQWEQTLRFHMSFLSTRQKQGYESYLKGDGTLSIKSEYPNSSFWLYPYKTVNRRLCVSQKDKRLLGTGSLTQVPIPMGSYLLKIETPGYADVLYPIYITRKDHVFVAPPNQTNLRPIHIPKEVSNSLCYIPCGWFIQGGDTLAVHSPSQNSVWLDSFFIQKFPVTNRDYLIFLNDLVAQGRKKEAILYCPQEAGGLLLYQFDEDHFQLKPDEEGDRWELNWPVMMVSQDCAKAYAAWKSRIDGRVWTLPTEEQWEKSARGADTRSYPWGDYFDPSWACMRSSKEKILPSSVMDFPIDTSPFGVRGMAGNMIDWTLTIDNEKNHVVYKGGAWGTAPQNLRICRRGYSPSKARRNYLGFRLITYP